MATALLSSLADTQIIEVNAEQTICIGKEEFQKLRDEEARRVSLLLADLESFAAMRKDERWSTMKDFNDSRLRDYERAIEFCDNEGRQKYLHKMIRGIRARAEQIMRMEWAMSS